MTSEKKITVVYIVGSGHCGSTLLNILLNGHSSITGLSEVGSLNRRSLEREARMNPAAASFWERVEKCYKKATSEGFDMMDLSAPSFLELFQMPEKSKKDYIEKNYHIFTCVSRQTGTRIVVDASKFWQRLYLLYRSRLFDVKVIHLVRDGRAVVCSYMKKYGGFRYAIRRWMGSSIMASLILSRIPEDRCCRIRYEDLVLKPEGTLRAIAGFLCLEFEQSMLSMDKTAHIGIGGNRMRFAGDSRIMPDDSWRTAMRKRHKLLFALVAGWLNYCYGYHGKTDL